MKRSMFSIRSILMVICFLCGLFSPIEIVDAQRRPDSPPTTIQRLPSSPTTTQPATTAAEELNKLIVMIKCQIADDESFGAGIVFGKGSNRLYIATANHVVRRDTDEAQRLRIQFKWMRGEWKTAVLLDNADRDLDLAVLAIDLSSQDIHVDGLRWDQLGDPGSLKSGDSVYSVGYPNGEAWRSFVTPDKVYQKSLASILFESNFVSPGNSGGALLNDRRELVGMIRDVGKAVSIQSVVDILNQWGYPVGLKASQEGPSNPTADSSSPSKSILGTWNVKCLRPPCALYWSFSQDGTAIFTAPGQFSQTYKYVLDGATLRTELISDSQGAESVSKIGETDVYTVKFDADTMTWKHLSSGLVLVWTREH